MKKLDIIYEDKYLLVVNKEKGKLTIQDNKGKSISLYNEVYEYLHKKNQKVFIVHRLDKDTSGLVLFAKKEEIKRYLQDNWNSFYREYIAVVEGSMEKEKEKLISYLKESKTLKVYISSNGEKAITNYEVIKKNNKYSMLKINIETGKKHQIRCQLSSINHPIVGDKKYNSKNNYINRLALHANKLIIKHPITNEKMIFESDYPKIFDNLLK